MVDRESIRVALNAYGKLGDDYGLVMKQDVLSELTRVGAILGTTRRESDQILNATINDNPVRGLGRAIYSALCDDDWCESHGRDFLHWSVDDLVDAAIARDKGQ